MSSLLLVREDRQSDGDSYDISNLETRPHSRNSSIMILPNHDNEWGQFNAYCSMAEIMILTAAHIGVDRRGVRGGRRGI
jgi:hypothetical protein